MKRLNFRAALAAALIAVTAAPAFGADGKIAVELNDLQQAENGCRAVFVLNNGLAEPLDQLAMRVVAFDKDEHASLFLTLDVGALPVGKTRVLRFDLGADLACDKIGRLVLDDVTACKGGAYDPAKCLAAVTLTSRAGAAFDF
jgi:hypothetical protein